MLRVSSSASVATLIMPRSATRPMRAIRKRGLSRSITGNRVVTLGVAVLAEALAAGALEIKRGGVEKDQAQRAEQVVCQRENGRTVRNFVRRLGMIGRKEPNDASTQRPSHPRRCSRPAAGWRRSEDGFRP